MKLKGDFDIKTSKPNLVFISSDQHTFRAAGFMGHPFLKTPNLDKIASRGVACDNHYTGSPICVPGRACMMTGMYSSDLNSFGNTTVYDGSYPTWGKRLTASGYYCWATGKMDLNDKFDLGFKGDADSNHSKKPDVSELFRRPALVKFRDRDHVNGDTRTKRYKDKDKAEKAVDFIKNKSKSLGKPWAAYVGFHMPHPKFVALKEYFDYYLPLAEPPYLPDKYLESLPMPMQVFRHFKAIATKFPDENMVRARAAYYAMVTELDDYIGMVYDAVEKSGQLDNTYFIYTSDHGEGLGYNGLWLKSNLYEGAAHIPLVFSGPELPHGKRITKPTGHIDLVATMMEWTGLGNIKELRGRSLTPLIKGEEKGGPGFAYVECHSQGNLAGSFMYREDEWKLIHFTWYGDGLFNLKDDPNEYRNLADEPAYKNKTEELKKKLHSLVDTEAMTLHAFELQNKHLKNFNDTLSRTDFINLLKAQFGQGQAEYMVDKFRKGMSS